MDLIVGDRVYIRRLTNRDVTERYVGWLNDKEVNQYLESRFVQHNIDSTLQYLASVTNDRNYAFGIFLKDRDIHIGNVKLGNINIRHGYADIGFLIGEKEYWRGGFGSEAVGLATTFGFNYLSLNKIYGGVYSVNAGSVRVFQKNGYVLEGCERKKCLLDTGERCDVLIYGKLRDELL